MKKFPARLTFYLLNLLAAILLVCVIGYFVLSHLESYTQHGQFIPVPAFNDLTVEEARGSPACSFNCCGDRLPV